MAAKVAEANAGIHSLAMSVAPVTSWRLYDSIYTERYMGLPKANPGGYLNASISNATGFHNINYLLAHGSGDDNGASRISPSLPASHPAFHPQCTMPIRHIYWTC